MKRQNFSTVEALTAARSVADYACRRGVELRNRTGRRQYDHLGAVLADCVLQAGLRYSTVVRPRINRILCNYPQATTSSYLFELSNSGLTMEFLDWRHQTKATRFDQMVFAIYDLKISDTSELKKNLQQEDFCDYLQSINGIGPKTVDYMACLTGLDAIAVDRHIKKFAQDAGLDCFEYYFLKQVFSYAADLLSISRRDFDGWVWQYQSDKSTQQLSFYF